MKKKIINIIVIVMVSVFSLVIGAKAASTITASQVTYNGTTVKAQLDTILNSLATYCPSGYSCTAARSGARYAYGKPTTSSSTDYSRVMAQNNSLVVGELYNSKYSVCLLINQKLECFTTNYSSEFTRMKNLFGSANCSTDNVTDENNNPISVSYCSTSDESVACQIVSNGYLLCSTGNSACELSSDNSMDCYFD